MKTLTDNQLAAYLDGNGDISPSQFLNELVNDPELDALLGPPEEDKQDFDAGADSEEEDFGSSGPDAKSIDNVFFHGHSTIDNDAYHDGVGDDVDDSDWVDAFYESVGDLFAKEDYETEGEEYGQLTSNIPFMARPGTKNYGYDSNDSQDRYDPNDIDPYIDQGYSNSCVIRAQEIILRDYGILIPQEDLISFAEKNGWFDNGTRKKEHVGNILDACNVTTTRRENATIIDVISELRAGHRVMAVVDSDELWIKNEPNLLKRLFGEVRNRMNDIVDDLTGLPGCNHALVVAGVNINPNDPSDIHVILIDPGDGKVCIEYKFSDFEHAWRDGNHYLVSTNVPAPFQYNYETHEMEPSGFETSFFPADVELPEGLENAFRLTDSYYENYGSHSNPFGEDRPINSDVVNDIGSVGAGYGDAHPPMYGSDGGHTPPYGTEGDDDEEGGGGMYDTHPEVGGSGGYPDDGADDGSEDFGDDDTDDDNDDTFSNIDDYE